MRLGRDESSVPNSEFHIKQLPNKEAIHIYTYILYKIPWYFQICWCPVLFRTSIQGTALEQQKELEDFARFLPAADCNPKRLSFCLFPYDELMGVTVVEKNPW